MGLLDLLKIVTHVEQLNYKVSFLLPCFIYPQLGSNTLLFWLVIQKQRRSSRPTIT
jgi:hypothetical protein